MPQSWDAINFLSRIRWAQLGTFIGQVDCCMHTHGTWSYISALPSQCQCTCPDTFFCVLHMVDTAAAAARRRIQDVCIILRIQRGCSRWMLLRHACSFAWVFWTHPCMMREMHAEYLNQRQGQMRCISVLQRHCAAMAADLRIAAT